MKEIPTEAVGRLAGMFECDQMVVIGRTEGEDGGEQVVFVGRGPRNAKVAEEIATFLKQKVMGWKTEIGDDLEAAKSMLEGPEWDPNMGKRLIKLPGER